ncbi:MAG TPA: tripartite tricarboxylate transporter substrate binding protein [Xanthobacteraceae bacterium]|nr:tripartite tricarboxylate transporter substrate binding protein [Xanthobacteraceae bacterium]
MMALAALPLSRRKLVLALLPTAMAALGCIGAPAQAESPFPNRTIRILTQFPPGAVSDISLRILADRAGAQLGTQIIVQNQPSAAGVTAARETLAAPADGYTLVMLSNATAVSAATYKHMPFDPLTDFAAISGMSDFAYLFLTNGASPLHTMRDFVAAAKKKPGQLNVGTSAAGTTPYLTALLFKKAANIDFAVVPYKGAPDLTVALLRNDIDVAINAYGGYRDALAEKKLRALATTTAKRSAFLPDVPTTAEAGIADFEVSSWNGIYAPAQTPAPVIDRLAQAFHAALGEPDLKQKFSDLGIEPWPGTAAELSAHMKAEIVRWNKVVDDNGIERQ